MLLSCNQPKRDYIYNFKFNNFKYFEKSYLLFLYIKKEKKIY